jgi:hypothetical protein
MAKVSKKKVYLVDVGRILPSKRFRARSITVCLQRYGSRWKSNRNSFAEAFEEIHIPITGTGMFVYQSGLGRE